jgi:PAS domain S-box-containing protein
MAVSLGVIGIVRDITESKELQAVRDRLLERLHLQIDRLTLAYILTDADGRVLEWNPVAEKIFGYTKEEALGRTCLDLIIPLPVDDQVDEMIRRIRTGDMNAHSVNENRTKDGRIRTCEWFNTPLIEADGTFVGAISLAQDITERKRAEEAIQENRRRSQAVFENALDAILLMDDAGRYVDGNPAICQLLGYSREELLNLTVWDVTPVQDRERIPELLSRFLSAGMLIGEYSLLCKDGATREVEYHSVANILPGLHLSVHRDITEGKRVEEALGASEEGVRFLAESIPHMIWAARPDGHVDYYNTRARDYFGVAPEQVQGQTWADPIHPDDRQHAVNAWEQAFRNGAEYRIEYRIRNSKTGEYRWFIGHALPQREPGGRVVRWFGTCTDIDERKRAERELRESEEQFRLLLDSTGEAIFGLDLDGRCTFCNAAFLRLMGYADVRELLGKEMHRLIHHTRADGTPYPLDECHIYRAFRQGEGTHVEDEVLWRADGITFPAEYWSYPVRRGGEVVGAVVTFVDISERRRVEEELRTLNAALENAVEGIARVDTQGRYLSVNPAYAGMLGYHPGELVGMDWQPTVHPEDLEETRAAHRRMLGEGRAEAEVLGVRKDRSTFWKQVVMVKAQSEQGDWAGHHCFAKDITDRKLAEEAMRDYAERLQVLSRRVVEVQEEERRHLARELHDEIGQILTAIGINLQTLKRTCGTAMLPHLEECIGIIRRAIEQVRHLSLDLRPAMLDDLGLVATLRWYLDRQAQRVGYRAQFAADPAEVRLTPAVATAAFRVAQEALTNVARHARARRVWVRLRSRDGALRLVVCDDGAGFDPEATLRRGVRGEGIGLLGMRERAALLGGRIEIRSAPGRGTVVRLTLPQDRAEGGA